MPTPSFVLVSTSLDSKIDASFSTERSSALTRAKANRDTPQAFTTSQVRRPLRGIQIKEDTFATMSVLGGVVQTDMHNSSVRPDDVVPYTSNFILQSVSESRSEKFQPMTTFGASYGFFFGEQIRIQNFSATLLNTVDFQWEIEWWRNYEEWMRGTRLTDRRQRAYLSYDDVVIEGYLVGASTQKNANSPSEVSLSFSMWVTNVEYLTPESDSGGQGRFFPTDPSQSLGIDPTGAIGGFGATPVTTSAVRARNMSLLTNTDSPGLLSKLRSTLGTVQDYTGKAGASVRNAQNFLFGRNLVVPAGFSANATATGVTEVPGFGSSFMSRTLPNSSMLAPVPRPFFDNTDEYVARGDVPSDPLAIRNTLSKYTTVPTDIEMDALAEQSAIDAFAKQGLDLSTMRGTSELSRTLGQVTFGCVSIVGAMGSQTAANIAAALRYPESMNTIIAGHNPAL